jgi:RNA polymerase sigma-70 factor, ECF subfamily
MPETAPDSTETRRLLGEIAGGDRRAFERLFARHQTYLRQVISLRLDRRMRARLDPSDVVQETQMEAFRRLPDYLERRPMPFRLWLRKTAQERLLAARRQHVDAARRAVGRELPLPDRSSVMLARHFLARGPSPSEQLTQRELARRVRQAVAQLSDNDQEVLLLRAFEGLSNEETACILEIDPVTASKRHGRALLRLHRLLADAGLGESQP